MKIGITGGSTQHWVLSLVIPIFQHALPCVSCLRPTSYLDVNLNTKSPLSVQVCRNGLAHLFANYFIFHVLAVYKAGDRGRYAYIESNDYHLKAVSGRPVIMRVFLWDHHMPCSLRDQQGIFNRLTRAENCICVYLVEWWTVAISSNN